MALHEGEVVVKSGTFLYDGTVTCNLRIVRSQVCPGSGDWEDPPELAEDKEGELKQQPGRRRYMTIRAIPRSAATKNSDDTSKSDF